LEGGNLVFAKRFSPNKNQVCVGFLMSKRRKKSRRASRRRRRRRRRRESQGPGKGGETVEREGGR